MNPKNEIVKIIYQSIEEVNELSGVDVPLKMKSKLFGAESYYDSLDLVSLIIAVEEKLNIKYNTNITIADEKAISQKNSPFISVETLTEYLVRKLNK